MTTLLAVLITGIGVVGAFYSEHQFDKQNELRQEQEIVQPNSLEARLFRAMGDEHHDDEPDDDDLLDSLKILGFDIDGVHRYKYSDILKKKKKLIKKGRYTAQARQAFLRLKKYSVKNHITVFTIS